MGILNVAEIKPDMVLADDLKNSDGRFLLARGTKLEPKHLRVMKMWGVVEANVQGVSQEDAAAETVAHLDPEVIEEARETIRGRFIHTDLDTPPMDTIFRLCALRKAEEISGIRPVSSTENTDSSLRDLIKNDRRIISHFESKLDSGDPVPRNIKLPSLPTIYGEVNEMIHNPKSSAADIGNIISKDTSLSARLLKLVNSAFYGFPSKIETLSRAITIVGSKQLIILVLGVNVMNVFKDIPSDLINMKSFWKHSISCGIIARIIGNYKKVQNTERLFIGGLLHDIGRLVLYSHRPQHAKVSLLRALADDILVYPIEEETMGLTHAGVGARLLKMWKLPLSLENIVGFHHDPDNSKDPLYPSIVHLADVLANALEMGSSGERFVPPMSPNAWGYIDITPNILNFTISQMDRQIEDIIEYLHVEP